MNADEPKLLIVETSGRVGRVAVASGEHLLAVRQLDEARRHARDLAPAVSELLSAQGWRARDLNAVIVSRGPGSYTGLRVGIMSAKALAYATGCALVAVDTFAAIAWQAPAEALCVDVIADAQQDRIYVQRFARSSTPDTLRATTALAIRRFSDWLGDLDASVWSSGPGLHGHEAQLPAGQSLVPVEARDPRAESLLHFGLERYRCSERDDVWNLEPLYLRPSSAEEKWGKK